MDKDRIQAIADKYDPEAPKREPVTVEAKGGDLDELPPVAIGPEYRPMPPPMDVGEDLPDLGERDHAFVLALCEGLEPSEAYRRSHDVDGWKPGSVATAAWKLRHRPAIAKWLKAARIAGVANAGLTVDRHLRELERLRELSVDQGDLKSAVAAEHLRGKVSGFYIERHETVIHHDPSQLLQRLAALAPDAANALARRFGLPMPALSDRSAEPATIDAKASP